RAGSSRRRHLFLSARRQRFGLTAPRPRHKTEVRPARLLLLVRDEKREECSLALVLVEIDLAHPVIEIYPVFLYEFMPLGRGVDGQRSVGRDKQREFRIAK